ncbi:general secretion pathway protein GspC [Geobacter sp. FeAm09]|uniref:type II secretion system protein GspC n=1 Tax=Geobacter sp. FeAm09 TaxID=2597769 RepID=UPI0011EDFFFA|nr:type II secretion system protein GspC [Geobacter sp. FeAm09]QEM68939.1 general secretion pathway protein GspC [Geobacter sp. FeAm09]
MQRAVTIVNYLLGAVIIVFLAALTAGILGRGLNGAFTPTAAAGAAKQTGPATAAPGHVAPLTAYAPVLTNGLFGKATQGQLTPFVNASSATRAAVPATAPAELLLLGTATGSFRETFALVRNSAKQEERVFRLGDMVFDAGRLAEVRKERAFIVVAGKKVELLSPTAQPPAPPSGTSQASSQGGTGVTNTGGGNFVIDQRALNAALDNPAQAMGDARLLPNQKDGKVEGFRASEVKPNGVFAMIGVKNGDVLQRLNDFPIDSPDKALQSFIALKGQSKLKLDVIRDGRPSTLTYDIR